MAAASLPAPGTEYGPCDNECEHTDCASDHNLANTPCKHCGEKIGFESMFYKLGDDWTELAHQWCHLGAIGA